MTIYTEHATTARAYRSGMTLLEVLVSLFVLSIGLLGVMAALPIGGFAIQKASIADRSSACGRAALAEVKIRDMVNPENWIDTNNGSVQNMYSTPSSTVPKVQFDSAFAIDPLFLLTNSSYVNRGVFPYEDNGLANTLERVNLATMTSQSLAERLFTWDDQLLFGEVTTEDTRPRMMQNYEKGVYESPVRPWESSLTGTGPYTNACKGDFSWMLTVMPKAVDHDTGFSTESMISGYEVSAVVFHKRMMLPPTNAADPEQVYELAVDCVVPVTGTAIGGGDVKIYSNSAGMLGSFRDIEYLMLSGTENVRLPDGTPDTRTVCHWYRVIGYGEVEAGDNADPSNLSNMVWVTLNGPDWDAGTPCTAILTKDVVGVYTTTVSADENLLWE